MANYIFTQNGDNNVQIGDVAAMANKIARLTAALSDAQKITGNTSDGYHTFNELYHHRAILFAAICNDRPKMAWKARKHNDGTMYDGMFIVGIETSEGQATYHYDLCYWDAYKVRELETAPEWDGHTPAQAIERIGSLPSLDTALSDMTAERDALKAHKRPLKEAELDAAMQYAIDHGLIVEARAMKSAEAERDAVLAENEHIYDTMIGMDGDLSWTYGQIGELNTERDALKAERDALKAERDAAQRRAEAAEVPANVSEAAEHMFQAFSISVGCEFTHSVSLFWKAWAEWRGPDAQEGV